MSAVRQGKWKPAVICTVVCGSGLLLLLLGLRGTRHDKGPIAKDPEKGTVQAEPARSGTQGDQSANVPPVTGDSAKSNSNATPSPAREVDAPGAADAGLSDVEELTKRQVSESATGAIVAMEIQNIERTQDRVMDGWPQYVDVREQLLAELSRKYSLADLSAEDLVKNIVALREQFWQEGGNLSASAWKPGYEARLLAELAAEKAPDNLAVIDELVETLQSITPMSRFGATVNEVIINKELWTTVEKLREKQFTQIKTELAAGRKATFRDFVCGADLLCLVQDMPPNHQHSIEVLQDLQAMCRENGWSKFLPTLRRVEATIQRRGYGYGFNIYLPRKSRFPEEYGYHRRFPSFRGPSERDMALLEQLP